MIARICWLLSGGAFTCVGSSASAASLEVEEAVWARDVRDLAYVDRVEGVADPRQPLVFWTLVRGDDAALAEMQARGALPIQHKWVRYVGPEPDLNTLRPTDEISVGAAPAAVFDRLRAEVSARGFFDWRTWSIKRNLRNGNWVVEVLYRTGEPVLCPTPSNPAAACRYRIAVRAGGR